MKLLKSVRNVMMVSTLAAAALVAAGPPVGIVYDTCGDCECSGTCAACTNSSGAGGACCCGAGCTVSCS